MRNFTQKCDILMAPLPAEASHTTLYRLAERDTHRLIIRSLRGWELVVAWLRTAGLPDTEIAEILGVTPAQVSNIITHAQKRIVRRYPCTASWFRGRTRRPENRATHAHTIHGLAIATYSPAQLARRLGLTTQTVTRWCRDGRFPHAHRTDAGRWLIPAEDLEAIPGR